MRPTRGSRDRLVMFCSDRFGLLPADASSEEYANFIEHTRLRVEAMRASRAGLDMAATAGGAEGEAGTAASVSSSIDAGGGACVCV